MTADDSLRLERNYPKNGKRLRGCSGKDKVELAMFITELSSTDDGYKKRNSDICA